MQAYAILHLEISFLNILFELIVKIICIVPNHTFLNLFLPGKFLKNDIKNLNQNNDRAGFFSFFDVIIFQ